MGVRLSSLQSISTLLPTSGKARLKNRYSFGLFHMPREAILVLNVRPRPGRYFASARFDSGANKSMFPTIHRIDKQLFEFPSGSGAERVLDAHALCHGHKIHAFGRSCLCSARGFVNPVVENNMNQILWLLPHDRRQPAQVHQQRSIAIERDDPSLAANRAPFQVRLRTPGQASSSADFRRLDDKRSIQRKCRRRIPRTVRPRRDRQSPSNTHAFSCVDLYQG